MTPVITGPGQLTDSFCMQEVEVKKSATTLQQRKKLVNRRHRCDCPHGLSWHYGLVVHMGSATDKYIWHSKFIGGVGGLGVILWCQNYYGAVNRNSVW